MKYHFIGIGGIGMSALAHILLEKGFVVSGSDLKKSATTEALRKKGATIYYEHDKNHIQLGQTVVYSSAISPINIEWQQAKRYHQLLHRSQLLQQLLEEKKALFIVGAHGKTTTAALLSYIFSVAKQEPSFVIGGLCPSLLGRNGKRGDGDYFIVEGDESDGSFLLSSPFGAIVTNIDFDHLDYWKTEKALIRAYQKFLFSVQESRFLFYRYEDRPFFSKDVKGLSFGESEKADVQIKKIYPSKDRQRFDMVFQGRTYREIELCLFGRHNVFHALSCFGMSLSLGIQEDVIRKALCSFKGVHRRFEWKGERQGALIYDDYAHHPLEIKATLSTLQNMYTSRRKIAVFQPHRYSRVAFFLEEFTKIWQGIDELIITDIYAAGEEESDKTLFFQLLKKMQRAYLYIPRKELFSFLCSYLTCRDVVVTLGAGDITEIGTSLVES